MNWISRLVACILMGGAGMARAAQLPMAITPDNPASLQAGIDAAYKAGLKKIVVPPGVYRVSAGSRGVHLRFADLSDFEIDAAGVTLLRLDQTRGGIEFFRCRNVTLRGMTLINQTPPFTQGTITALDPAGMYFDVRIDRGYPANFDDPKYFPASPTGYVFDRNTRQWKPGAQDYYFKRTERRGDGSFRLFFDRPVKAGDHGVRLGDPIAFRGRGGADIRAADCERMNIDQVTIRNGGGFTLHEADGEGHSRYSFTVTYGPRPAGATVDPLIACNADAFHSSNVRHGPIVEGCRFEGMPDDGVAIHGSYAMVAGVEGRRLVLARGDFFRAQDPIRLFDERGAFAGEAIVASVRRLGRDYQPVQVITRDRFKNARSFIELTLDRDMNASFGWLVSDPNAVGSGYVVRNNVISNHRARGMLLKADNGLVENNLVEGSTIDGIVIAPEFWWAEACYSRNVIVRHNTIRHVGYAMVGSWTGQAGALTIGSADDKPVLPPGHRHLVIEENTFEDCDGINMLITSAQDVLVKNNRFVRPQQHATDRGKGRGFDPSALIWIGHCQDVRLQGNIATDVGVANRALVRTDDRVEKCTGLVDGVTTTSGGGQ